MVLVHDKASSSSFYGILFSAIPGTIYFKMPNRFYSYSSFLFSLLLPDALEGVLVFLIA